MKITKAGLTQIIKEELASFLESHSEETAAQYDAKAEFEKLVNGKVYRPTHDPLNPKKEIPVPAVDGLPFEEWYEENKGALDVQRSTRRQTARSREMVRKHGVGDPEWDIRTDPDADVWEHKNKQ